mmetsp:Transcript_9891/g.17508  ORF Transcript_9891/g.17508 Transcript_9891/m.17508 type:complete len:612 (-) Transcript_9891:361-2196(-)
MKRANKRPSEWLKLLCKDWAQENQELVEATDHKFLQYKPYLKGLISSQLLCRLCIPAASNKYNNNASEDGDTSSAARAAPAFDFWQILDIQDEFDKSYIIAQVERFCTLYNIRGGLDASSSVMGMGAAAAAASNNSPEAAVAAAAAAAAAAVTANGTLLPSHLLTNDVTQAALAAVQTAAAASSSSGQLQQRHATSTSPDGAVAKAQRLARVGGPVDAASSLDTERKQTAKRRQSQERKIEKQREREQLQIKKLAEKMAREASREEKRRKKLEQRTQRERFAQEQKEAALKRAAELVASNRVPIEITRGASAAKAAAQHALQQLGASSPSGSTNGSNNNTSTTTSSPVYHLQQHSQQPDQALPGPKKQRSAIVVSTASDLHQIVTHSKNLWAKYNAIAKEHNQKVNWITVSKELGIHVKVREKYARMHSRAEQRGFDWVANGHWKIRDHPEIFVEPTQAEQKARMAPPLPDASRTVLISELGSHKEGASRDLASSSEGSHSPSPHQQHHDAAASSAIAMGTDEAAVAAAAAVVDAAGVGSHMTTSTMDSTTNAAVASLVADPTNPSSAANLKMEGDGEQHQEEQETEHHHHHRRSHHHLADAPKGSSNILV